MNLSSQVCNNKKKKCKNKFFFLLLYKRASDKTIAHFTFRMKLHLQELDCSVIWMGRTTHVVANLSVTAHIPNVSPSQCLFHNDIKTTHQKHTSEVILHLEEIMIIFTS